MNIILIQLYEDRNKDLPELHIYENWVADYNHLFCIYDEDCIKNKIIESIKKSAYSNFVEFEIHCNDEELFYLKLKYGMSHSYFFDEDIIGSI